MAFLTSTTFQPTNDALIDVATQGGKWVLPESRQIHWAIADGFLGEFWVDPEFTVAVIDSALSTIEVFLDIDFVYSGYFANPNVAGITGADVVYSLDSSNEITPVSSWAIGYYPNALQYIDATAPVMWPSMEGDIFLNTNEPGTFQTSFLPGSEGYSLVLHETFHALGLKHPFQAILGRPSLDSIGLGEFDKEWISVMSYDEDTPLETYKWDPASPMMLDIIALQYLYGENTTTNSGDEIHYIQDVDFFYSIWDAAGNDTVDLSLLPQGWHGQLPGRLPEGLAPLVDTKVGFGLPLSEYINELPENPSELVWFIGDIENLNGTNYDDELFGNSLNNYLFGGLGSDLLEAGGGNDTVNGGAGADTLVGGDGGDIFLVMPGDEQIIIQDFQVGVDSLDLQHFDRADALSAFYSAQAGSAVLTFGDGTVVTVDGEGVSPDTLSLNDVEFTAGNLSPVGSTVIEGTAAQGQTLTANTDAVEDLDGIDPLTEAIQWLRQSVPIPGATGKTYVLTQEDVGSQISVNYSYRDNFGTPESVTSAATAAVANINDDPTGAVVISGTTSQGSTLTADTSGLADPDGLGDFSYQWLRNNNPIPSATGNIYTLMQDDVGSQISVEVSYTDGGGTAERVISSSTSEVTEGQSEDVDAFFVADSVPDSPYLAGLLTEGEEAPSPVGWTTELPLHFFFADNGTRPWSEAEKSAARLAFESWNVVIDLEIEETDDIQNADIFLSLNESEEYLGFATVPAFGDYPGDARFSTVGTNFDYLALGGDSYHTLVHEIGHLLGLFHPHEGTPFPGVPIGQDQEKGEFDLNQQIWTTMSYVTGWDQEPAGGLASGRAAGPMALDIAAAQFLYGARDNEEGVTVYTLPTENGEGVGWLSIWDTGGEDWIDGSSAEQDVQIDLRDAELDGENAGGFVSWAKGVTGGFTVAAGVIIENAWGGSGEDTLIGNSSTNQLVGNDGNDVLLGLGGDDTLFGDANDDVLSGGSGNDFLLGGSGSDRFIVRPGDENVTIQDFEVGVDLLDLIDFDRANALSAFYSAQAGSAVLTFGDGTVLTVDGDGVSPDSLLLNDIVFADGNLVPEGDVLVTGEATDGQTLLVDVSGVMDADGINLATTAFQWLRDDAEIAGATGSSYRLAQDDVGAMISVRYSYTDNFDTPETVTSAATDAVRNANDVPTGAVLIEGTAAQGQTLTANTDAVEDPDGVNASTEVGQWLRDGTPITGATSETYVLTADDVGAQISVVYSYTDNFGTPESVTSDPTAVVSTVGLNVVGTPFPDPLEGSPGADTIQALASDDTITGSAGNDQIDGGEGTDTVVYSGDQASFTVALSPTGTSVTDRRPDGNGADSLTHIEILDFDSGTFDPLNLSVFGGPANLSDVQLESFIELYIAYFNRAPDAIGLNFWGTAFANGLTLAEMAAEFGPQDETHAAYPPGTSNEVFATTVYNNVLGRTPDQAGIDFWVGQLDMGNVSRDQFILNVLQGAKSDLKPELGPDFVAQQLADQAYLENKIDIGAYFAVHKGMSDVDNASAAMAHFDGTEGSITDAVNAIDGFFTDALDPADGEFLMPLVGVLDDPFAMV